MCVCARRSFAALRPITLVMKSFLAQRQLNEVFTGGVGSYALVNLIIAHLQTEQKRSLEADDLGYTLLSFLHRYGCSLDYQLQAVSVARGGIVARTCIEGVKPAQEGKIFIEDPQELRMDVGYVYATCNFSLG